MHGDYYPPLHSESPSARPRSRPTPGRLVVRRRGGGPSSGGVATQPAQQPGPWPQRAARHLVARAAGVVSARATRGTRLSHVGAEGRKPDERHPATTASRRPAASGPHPPSKTARRGAHPHHARRRPRARDSVASSSSFRRRRRADGPQERTDLVRPPRTRAGCACGCRESASASAAAASRARAGDMCGARARARRPRRAWVVSGGGRLKGLAERLADEEELVKRHKVVERRLRSA